MLGTAYRKTIHAEVTDHFWYVVERLAELAQDVRVQFLVLLDAHVHEATGASGKIGEERDDHNSSRSSEICQGTNDLSFIVIAVVDWFPRSIDRH